MGKMNIPTFFTSEEFSDIANLFGVEEINPTDFFELSMNGTHLDKDWFLDANEICLKAADYKPHDRERAKPKRLTVKDIELMEADKRLSEIFSEVLDLMRIHEIGKCVKWPDNIFLDEGCVLLKHVPLETFCRNIKKMAVDMADYLLDPRQIYYRTVQECLHYINAVVDYAHDIIQVSSIEFVLLYGYYCARSQCGKYKVLFQLLNEKRFRNCYAIAFLKFVSEKCQIGGKVKYESGVAFNNFARKAVSYFEELDCEKGAIKELLKDFDTTLLKRVAESESLIEMAKKSSDAAKARFAAEYKNKSEMLYKRELKLREKEEKSEECKKELDKERKEIKRREAVLDKREEDLNDRGFTEERMQELQRAKQAFRTEKQKFYHEQKDAELRHAEQMEAIERTNNTHAQQMRRIFIDEINKAITSKDFHNSTETLCFDKNHVYEFFNYDMEKVRMHGNTGVVSLVTSVAQQTGTCLNRYRDSVPGFTLDPSCQTHLSALKFLMLLEDCRCRMFIVRVHEPK